jgi:hypothetical protein
MRGRKKKPLPPISYVEASKLSDMLNSQWGRALCSQDRIQRRNARAALAEILKPKTVEPKIKDEAPMLTAEAINGLWFMQPGAVERRRYHRVGEFAENTAVRDRALKAISEGRDPCPPRPLAGGSAMLYGQGRR